jgi:hypothetical protein
MGLNAKVGIVTAVGALAVTGPAVAEACTHGQQRQQGQVQPAAQSRGAHAQFSRFGRGGRRFGRSELGTLVSWSANQTGTNTYSGTITVSKPASAAHHAGTGSSSQQTHQVTYTFTNARVSFGRGANPPAAGDLVKVIGARLGHCKSGGSGTSSSTTSSTSTSTGNVRAIFIAAPRSSSSS